MAVGDIDGRTTVGIGLELGRWVVDAIAVGAGAAHAHTANPMIRAATVIRWSAVRS
jgi:hypothetical protein